MKATTLDVEITTDPKRRRQSRARCTTEAAPPRIPRIARLMALAIKFQDMVERGEVRDYADVARLGYVSRARITQIMNLLNLAPDIQEEIVAIPPSFDHRKPLSERHVRTLSAMVSWTDQRKLWQTIRQSRLLTSESC